MSNPNSTHAVSVRTAETGLGGRRRDRGEGVISTAIAVLIIAFLGAAMWLGFNTLWTDAQEDIKAEVSKIGG